MKQETLSNFCWMVLWAILGILALSGAIFCGATWHYITAAMCSVFVYMMYVDNAHGIESVKQYFTKVAEEKRNR